MPLTASDDSLDWALKHAEVYGDTDIFPPAFEFEAIRASWAEIKAIIQQRDILEWSVRPFRRCLVPKHRFGFRISTQVDPLDFLVFTALIHEIGQKLESMRIPASEQIVHSYRFDPNTEGRLFSESFSYRSFQRSSHDICVSHSPTHVVIADIADFFPRLYTHRVDNALDRALGLGHMHAVALKRLIAQWAGAYSYGIPVGLAASRLIAEVTIADLDQLLLSENAKYVRYSDDFRVFCSTEAEAYRLLTVLARGLFENHGLTLQQHKTRIIPAEAFREIYLRENEKRELDTLSERFYELLESLGLSDTYEDIEYDSLPPDMQALVDQLNLEGILEEQIEEEEPDLALLRFILRRLGQLDDPDAVELIFDNFPKFVPVVREVITYVLRLRSLSPRRKAELGRLLVKICQDENSTASHLEYSRMYLLHPFAVDKDWNCDDEYVTLFADAMDEFTRRELLLALGRSGKDFWFRGRKQYLGELPPWLRRSFIYAASCLPRDEYKHWIRGMDRQLDDLERACASWAAKHPVA